MELGKHESLYEIYCKQLKILGRKIDGWKSSGKKKNRGFAVGPGKQNSKASFTLLLFFWPLRAKWPGWAGLCSHLPLAPSPWLPPELGTANGQEAWTWVQGLPLGLRQESESPCSEGGMAMPSDTHTHTHTIKSPSHNLKGHHQQPHHLTPSPEASQIPHPRTHLRECTHTCCTCKELGSGVDSQPPTQLLLSLCTAHDRRNCSLWATRTCFQLPKVVTDRPEMASKALARLNLNSRAGRPSGFVRSYGW